MNDAAHGREAMNNIALLASAVGNQRVSVIMANLNGEAHIRQAIRSVLDQTHRNLELIVSDDGSQDDSRRIVREAMALDLRVRLIEASAPSGPAAARNRALAAATGDWVAIIDSDDLIHPDRLRRMVLSALLLQADILADDMVFFGDDPLDSGATLLQPFALQGPQQIDAVKLVSGCIGGKENTSVGYLKPLIRRAAVAHVRYDETLQIDEDHDFYLRLVLSGAKFMVIPDAMYLYRRHGKSLSHRQSAANLEKMISAQAALLSRLPPENAELQRAVKERVRAHVQGLSYVRALDALKARNWPVAAWRLFRNPRNLLFLLQTVKERGLRRHRPEQVASTPLKLMLCQQGQAPAKVPPGFVIFEVPEVPDAGWSPSTAGIWAHLARLSCGHDLEIVAMDRAGHYALGMVPRYVSAEVLCPQPAAQDPARSDCPHFGPALCAEGV